MPQMTQQEKSQMSRETHDLLKNVRFFSCKLTKPELGYKFYLRPQYVKL